MRRRNTALLMALVLTLGIAPARAAAPGQKLAAITFDDGPGPYTENLLDELDKRGVVVTFFMQGHNAARYPSVVKRAYEAGHQIASHTYDHPQLTKLSSEKIRDQLVTTADILNCAVGMEHAYMVRPPYGSTDGHVLSCLDAPAILWSVDTRDWESRNADAVYRHIVNDTRDGSIVLLHDIHASSIPGALRGIDALLSQGYELVTVEELLRRRGYDAAPGERYYKAPGNTTLPGISKPVINAERAAGGQRVTLSADVGSTIYYTVDGTAPTSRSTVYTGPFLLENAATVKAFAARTLNGGRSRVSEIALDIPRAEAPVITLKNGMAVASADGEIHYTLDGTEPTENSELCASPVPLPTGTLIQAVAVRPGCRNSQISSLLRSDLNNLFSDVRGAEWYYHDVDQVVSRGWMTTEDQAFFPGRAVTRKELMTVLYRVAGSPNDFETASVPDVADTDPDYAAVMWAVDRHVLAGFEDGTVRLDDSVTREQLAVILFRMRTESADYEPSQTELYSFEDWKDIQSYAWNAVDWAVSSGLLSGVSDTMLAPGSTVTRAQLASVVLRSQTA